jgi:hypothetical protein
MQISLNDTTYQLFITRATSLIERIYIIEDSSGSITYNGHFFYGHTDDSIPYLEAVKLQGAPTFQRGGVEFQNILVNGKNDISAPDLCREIPIDDVSLMRINGTVRISLPSGSDFIGIYDLLGRKMHVSLSRIHDEDSEYHWDGCVSNGNQTVSGWYLIIWEHKEKRLARPFYLSR